MAGPLLSIVIVLAIIVFFAKKLFGQQPDNQESEVSYRPNALPNESQAAFITCTFSMLGKLAEVDGVISPEEVQKVNEYIDSTLNLDKKTKLLALRVFQEAADSPVELRDYAERFYQTYPDRVQLHDRVIDILVEVSAADGVISKDENQLIRSAALLLGLTEAGYERIKSKHVPRTIH